CEHQQHYSWRFGNAGSRIYTCSAVFGLAEMGPPDVVVVLCVNWAKPISPYDVIRSIHDAIAVKVTIWTARDRYGVDEHACWSATVDVEALYEKLRLLTKIRRVESARYQRPGSHTR